MMYMTEFRNGREELHWKYASPKSGKFVAHNSLVLGADGSCCYPRHEEGALDSVTLEALKPALEAAGFRVCGRRIRRSELIAASEVLVIGSGMGVRAIGSLDGVALGSSAAAPRSPRPLHRAAWAAWLDALKHGWTRPDT